MEKLSYMDKAIDSMMGIWSVLMQRGLEEKEAWSIGREGRRIPDIARDLETILRALREVTQQ